METIILDPHIMTLLHKETSNSKIPKTENMIKKDKKKKVKIDVERWV